MLRLYLGGLFEPRLNIWDSRYRVPDVSMIHTHPWNFSSVIVSGELTNVRYRELSAAENSSEFEFFHSSIIKPGPAGGLRRSSGDEMQDEPNSHCRLVAFPPEIYKPGDLYSQKAEEIHVSLPSDGCITVNLRERVGEDVARTFWPLGKSWVSAVPREATKQEIEDITRLALESL